MAQHLRLLPKGLHVQDINEKDVNVQDINLYVYELFLHHQFSVYFFRDLSDNDLEAIPPGLFCRKEPHGLKLLLLQRNSIKYILTNAFEGLDHLQVV